jgi:hypothetical protein
MFAAAGVALAMQPIDVRWFGAGFIYGWATPYGALTNVAYFIPNALATTAGFSLLPVMMLATVARHPLRARAFTVAVALFTVAIVDGFVAPAAMYWRDRDVLATLPEQHRAMWLHNYENIVDVVRRAQSADPPVAEAARLTLGEKSEMLAGAMALALLGIAVGHARLHRARRTGVLAATGWWLGAWLMYNALDYWSQFLVILLSMPAAWRHWIPPLIFAAIAALVLLTSRDPVATARSSANPAY